MKRTKKLAVSIVAVVIAMIAVTSMIMVPRVQKLNDFIDRVEIEGVDLQKVMEGQYTGKVDAGMIAVEVKVSIRDHAIKDIELLEHRNGKGDPANSIIDRITEQQSLEVDAVSGATLSSQVIKKAVENALKQGMVH